MTIEAPAPPAPPPLAPDEEALFPEARRRWSAIGVVGGLVVAGVVALVVFGIARGDAARTAAGPSATGVLPLGPYVPLGVAGPLAVSPTGALYVADGGHNRVLVRMPDGRFRVVAGNGRAGFSGDGGLAVHAELVGVSDLAFAPDGRLYIADGGHVRVVGRNGVITTVAGSGRGSPLAQKVVGGTPALAAPLGPAISLLDSAPLSIAVNPTGQLYISTGSQILRLTASGKLDIVRAVVTSGPYAGRSLGGFGPIAIDGSNIDVAGVNGWAIWQVSPDGSARQIGSAAGARRSGGDDSVLARGSGGAVFGEDGPALLRVDRNRLATVFTFGNRRVNGEYFWLTYFAFGPGGTVYADEIPGGEAFEAQQQLVAIRGKRVSLLWQQGTAATK